MIKAVLFDRDGVLIDSEYCNVENARLTFNKLGINVEKHELEKVIGRHPMDFLGYFTEKYGVSEKEFMALGNDSYFELLKKAEIFNEVVNFVLDLKKNDYLTAIVTSSNKITTDDVLKRSNLTNSFDAIITVEDCKIRKPDPHPYQLTAEKLGVKPEECLVLEDSKVGVESAKAANMKCLVIPTKYTEHQDFSKADLIIKRNELNLYILNNEAFK